jgi:sugar phosphate isomerase/epimerase
MNPITFSTLACPHWGIETVIAKASEFGYDGIEWRGGPQGHLQPDLPATRKSQLRGQCSDAGLMSLAITAYTSFISDSAKERDANVDELRRYADLAAEVGASYVRAFIGELPEGRTPDAAFTKTYPTLNCRGVCRFRHGEHRSRAADDSFVVNVVPILHRCNIRAA